ncbi:MAG: [Fe-Fe] hydrogenase large subunit C-terminal domain-containing protein [bacterium]
MAEDRHSILIDEEKCVGCVLCMRACPTKAIRVRKGKAVLMGERCVDCGECYRVCPYDAVIPLTTSFSDLKRFKYTVTFPTPSLYTQFGWEVMPNQILLALQKIGFNHVYDEAWMCEMVNAAIEEYIRQNPNPKPKISTVCPSVVRLVAYLYPELIHHIIPIESPRELAAKLLRQKISRELRIPPHEVGIIHITSCPAKMVSINRPIGLSKSYLDGAISVRDIYGRLLEVMQDVHEDVILQQSSGVGLGWAVAGGEVNGLSMDNCLAVSGVADVIQILDDVAAGKLRDIEYLECLVCPDGCVGGPQNVENRHLAKKRADSLVKMFGEKSRVSRKMILRLYNDDFFFMEKRIETHPFPPLDKDASRAIEKRRMMEEIIPQLPGKECGACGAPDCKTLARDIVLGQAGLQDCVFLKGRTVS